MNAACITVFWSKSCSHILEHAFERKTADRKGRLNTKPICMHKTTTHTCTGDDDFKQKLATCKFRQNHYFSIFFMKSKKGRRNRDTRQHFQFLPLLTGLSNRKYESTLQHSIAKSLHEESDFIRKLVINRISAAL